MCGRLQRRIQNSYLDVWQGSEYAFIVRTPPFLKEGGGSKFWLPPQEVGKSENLKKGGGKMVQGQTFLKGVAGTFPIYFFQGLSFLHLEITLPFAKLLCAFEENFFFLPA